MSSIELTTVTLFYPKLMGTISNIETKLQARFDVNHYWLNLEKDDGEDDEEEYYEKVIQWFQSQGFENKTVCLPELSYEAMENSSKEAQVWVRQEENIIEVCAYWKWPEISIPIAVVAAMREDSWGL